MRLGGAVAALVMLLATPAHADEPERAVPIPCAGTWTPHGPGSWDINVIGDETGNPVRAYWPGRVDAVRRWTDSYGWHVVIDHPNGRSTLYAHLSRIAASIGERVVRGEFIGEVGETGNATGAHLHFEIR